MIDPVLWKKIKLAMFLLFCGYVPMVFALKFLRHNGAFEFIERLLP